jgi:hypothetical protein
MEATNKTEIQMNTTTFGGHMVDFIFLPSDFNSTEITVVANSKDAKQYLAERYGFACVSLNVRKSAAPDLADSFEFQGLSYN